MSNFIKRSYSSQMSFDVSDKEKYAAKKALNAFTMLCTELREADDHLDKMKTPFNDNQQSDPEKLFEERAALRVYRDDMLEKFNKCKQTALKCVIALKPFDSDTQTIRLKNSFIMSVGDLEKQVNRFAALFDNIKDKDFIKKSTSAIDNVKKEVAQLEQIVEDRIKDHIRKNILAINWIDDVGEKLQMHIEQKSPLIVELMQEQEAGRKNNV